MNFDYSGQHVFVSGGTSGINLGVAHAFARAGAKLTVISRSQDKVEAAVTELKQHGGEVQGFSADVREYARVDEVLKTAAQAFGPIRVLISGAAGNFLAPALGMSANGFKTVVDIDLMGSFHIVRAAFAHLQKPGACIINISAPQAFNPMEFQMHVCAAKAGVDMITRVGAMEWGAAGVRINSVVPGCIEGTEGMRRLAPTPAAEKVARGTIPMGRFGTTQEVADACLWLASPMASYVTGVVLPVDGGQSLSGSSFTTPEVQKMLFGGKSG